MSFGGTVPRGRRGAGASGPPAEGPGRPGGLRGTPGRPTATSPQDGEIDWERVAVFGTGIALGVALGAGVVAALDDPLRVVAHGRGSGTVHDR